MICDFVCVVDSGMYFVDDQRWRVTRACGCRRMRCLFVVASGLGDDDGGGVVG